MQHGLCLVRRTGKEEIATLYILQNNFEFLSMDVTLNTEISRLFCALRRKWSQLTLKSSKSHKNAKRSYTVKSLKKKQQNNLLKEKVGMQEMQESNQLLS